MLNKLCLGTVQLGLKYGINNQIGRQPTNKEAFSILKAAIDYGIEYFDTSSSYGDAENLLHCVTNIHLGSLSSIVPRKTALALKLLPAHLNNCLPAGSI